MRSFVYLCRGFGRRRHQSAARRDIPCPQRYPLLWWAARVSAFRTGGASSAAWGQNHQYLTCQVQYHLPMLVHVCGIHESLSVRILQSSHQGLRLHSRSDSQIPQQDIWPLAGQQGKRRIECQTWVNSATDVVGYSKKTDLLYLSVVQTVLLQFLLRHLLQHFDRSFQTFVGLCKDYHIISSIYSLSLSFFSSGSASQRSAGGR